MDHSELIQEMVLLEKMTAQERLKHARRRRQQQLKNWAQREGLSSNNTTISTGIVNGTITTSTTGTKSIKSYSKTKQPSVKFPENIILLEATARQDLDEVRHLLQTGKYSPNTANEDGLTPMHQCSIDNSEKLLRLLIEYGADINARDRDLWTPLHAAATCGHLQICRILVENGAELLALNADGNMPYDICDDEITLDYIETQMDRIGITQEMIDKTRGEVENKMLIDLQNLVKKKSQGSLRSIDDILSYRNLEGVTPLHIASANGYQTVVEYLLKQNVSINLQDNDGWTPIHAAAFWCQQGVLAQLIETGADIYEKIPDGRSALDLCDDPDLRAFLVDFRKQNIRNQEKAAAAAAAAELQQKTSHRHSVNTNTVSNGTTSRTGTLYESRSSVSSPYGSGSSLNRTSSIRRASIRDREKVKKLNENFLDVLQAKDKIQEDADEPIANVITSNGALPTTTKLTTKEERANSVTTATDSTVREPATATTTTSVKKSIAPVIEVTLPPLKVPPPLPPTQTTADTLSDVKRRREERRRGIGGSSSTVPPAVTSTPPTLPMIDTNHKTNNGNTNNNNTNNNTKISNGIYASTKDDPLHRFTSPKHIEIRDQHKIDDDREKRICCTIL
ncbi:unnamed protein product [Rotaria sp. Silwood2]|nr:unnamed protein product [Rotaria sp. Silwood2]CAF2740703.1 unnamed protein product [Rotaria sp. Silwood2]CAF3016314.1 unnamed protein product [Rotaria sp. Silwood2]CAF3916577.1 unnamed protein product [Rotaria sp. Silwood2]CAF4001645.1 unnamed protein product [Rotaria sp. Silwood2]